MIHKIAVETADYFRKNGFYVKLDRYDTEISRRERTISEPYTLLTILWPEPREAESSFEELQDDGILEDGSRFAAGVPTGSKDSRAPSYQTGPLVDYDPMWHALASRIFGLVQRKVGRSRAKMYKGTFSILSPDSSYTAAKIVIHQAGVGKTNGEWPPLLDGVYVLLRADRGERAQRLDGIVSFDSSMTLGIAPKHEERFYYFLASESRTEEAARILAEWVN